MCVRYVAEREYRDNRFKFRDGHLPLFSWHSCCYDFSDRLIGVKKLRP